MNLSAVCSAARLSILAFSAASICLPAVSQADIISIEPTADGTVFDPSLGFPANTIDTTMAVSRSSVTPTLYQQAAVMEFDLSALPSNAVLESLTLTLEANAASSIPLWFTAEAFVGDGVVTQDDYSQPGGATSAFLQTAHPTGWNLLHWNLLDTSVAEQSLASPTQFLALRIKTEHMGDTIHFSTTESTGLRVAPSLQVQFSAVPEPTTFALVAQGLVVAAFGRRRKQSR